ncbi:MAG: hypothetical protein NTZ95_03355 [Candidatus Omnitrophica bacterium]|nr:hypothetical protein [Candidatus Omnitrophota bacterium]
MPKINIIIFFIISFLLTAEAHAGAQKNRITIYCDDITGNVNRKVFGNNCLGYIPYDMPSNLANADYGAGIWDSKWYNKPNPKVVNLAKQAGVSVMRFPGGCGTHQYKWKEAINKDRDSFRFGIDEFLEVCKSIGCEAIFTISYFEGDEQDAANLVEYLNTPYSEGIDVKYVWAAKRAHKGHSRPYGVKYFEIGNEDWHGDHIKINKVLPEEYAKRYLRYYDAIKKIDSSVMVGAILYSPEWNQKVMEIIKDKVDFGVVHIYPRAGVTDKKLEAMDPKDVFRIKLTVAMSRYDIELKKIHQLFKKNSGKDIPIAVTEYNGGLRREKPIPYRHSLGMAIINAELVRVLLDPENGVLMANYWNLVNEHWGMVANGFNGDEGYFYNPYFKRPSYYVYRMYHEHFGDKLLRSDIYSDSYAFKEYIFFSKDILNEIREGQSNLSIKRKVNIEIDDKEKSMFVPYLSVVASRDTHGNKVHLMVVNKNMDDQVTATIELKDFIPTGAGNVWILNGPSFDATNEVKHDNIKVTHKKFWVWSKDPVVKSNFEFTFEPHSLTAIEIHGHIAKE